MLRAERLIRTYATPAGPVHALQGVDHTFAPGRVTAVMGPSGSGKSTLLNLLAGFDRPDAGHVRLDDLALDALSETRLAALRLRHFGFVFQASNLISVLPARANVAFPMGLAGVPTGERLRRADALLARFGVAHRGGALPAKLSGGERQRVALARALANDPQVVFADEPTGNLDRKTGDSIADLLFRLNRDQGTALVLVTHDPRLAARCDRVATIDDGRLSLSDAPEADAASAATAAGAGA